MSEPEKFQHPSGDVLETARKNAKNNGTAAIKAELAKYRTAAQIQAALVAAERKAARKGKRTRRKCGDDFRIKLKVID